MELLELASDLGLKGVEVKLGRDELIAPDIRRWLSETLPTYNFRVYAHLPYLHGKVNLAAADPRLGLKALKIAMESVSFAASLGCSVANTHLGVALDHGPHIPRAMGRLKKILQVSLEMGVEICVENQERSCSGIVNTPDDVRTLLTCNPNIHLTYDPGHGNTHGFGIRDFLPAVLPRLRYLHLHDNNGSSDQHLALGRGNLDLELLMVQLGHQANGGIREIPTTLELSAQDLEPSIQYLKQHASGAVHIS